MKLPFFVWAIMRDAAVARHHLVHFFLEGADPKKWPAHEKIIKDVYGR